MRTAGERVTPSETIPVAVRDPKDTHLLAAALGGNAAFLVTGDADLLVLNGDPALGPLRIVTARAFLDDLARREEGPMPERRSRPEARQRSPTGTDPSRR